MAIPTYNNPYDMRQCGGAECMRRAGAEALKIVDERTRNITEEAARKIAEARRTVDENTRSITEEAARKIMEAEATMKAATASVQIHLDRIVALELELARLRSSNKSEV